MRLAEETTNYRASGVQRRDERHDPSRPARERKGHQPKNRRRWCKGRVGILHDWSFWAPGYRPDDDRLTRFFCGRMLIHRVCDACGRLELSSIREGELKLIG